MFNVLFSKIWKRYLNVFVSLKNPKVFFKIIIRNVTFKTRI